MKPISFVPQHRLADLLRRPGGVPVEEAIEQAQNRLAAFETRCLSALDEKIELLSASGAEAALALVTEIYSLAASFRHTEIATAARSLCELLGNWRAAKLAGTVQAAEQDVNEAIGVHVDALRALRQPELSGDAVARSAIVEGLKKVTAKAGQTLGQEDVAAFNP